MLKERAEQSGAPHAFAHKKEHCHGDHALVGETLKKFLRTQDAGTHEGHGTRKQNEARAHAVFDERVDEHRQYDDDKYGLESHGGCLK